MEGNCILPDDLVEDILSRLPIKDLLRSRCVSKGWCALIDSAAFIRKHYQAQYSFRKLGDNMTYFVLKQPEPVIEPIEEFYLVSIQQGGDVFTMYMTDDLKRDSEGVLPLGTHQYDINCHGCVNGIICLTCVSPKTDLVDDSFMALWNPATREFKTVTYPNDPGLINDGQWMINGFGFDLSSSDFKILGYYYTRKGDDYSDFHVIYSLKSNSWKRINNLPADFGGLSIGCSDGYLNGVYYWTYGYRDFELRPVIVSFNFATEVFKVSDLPQDALSLVLENYPWQKEIALYKERLALVISHKVSEEPLCTLRIWVSTQFDNCGAPVSWEHLFTIRQPTHPRKILNVNTILMNGDLQLLIGFPEGPSDEDYSGGREGYLYNHSKGEFKKFDFEWYGWFRYVESLFPLSKKLVQA